MQREPFANAAMTRPFAASGWGPWVPDLAETRDAHKIEEAAVPWLGGVISLLMWDCASVLAVWYL